MNSRTSRPRSPTSAMTLTSARRCCGRSCRAASTCRRPSRRRCRGAGRGRTGGRASSARTPSGEPPRRSRGRSSGVGGRPSTATCRTPRSSGPGRRSAGRGRRATRPSRPVADRRHAAGGRWPRPRRPGGCPPCAPSGISSVRPVAEADDLGEHRLAAARCADRADLADLGLRADRLDDEADDLDHAAADAVGVGAAPSRVAVGTSAAAQAAARSSNRSRARRSSCDSIVASMSPASVRTTTPPCEIAAVADQAEVLQAAERVCRRSLAPASRSRSSGLQRRSGRRGRRSCAARCASTPTTRRARPRPAGEDLLGDLEGELDELALARGERLLARLARPAPTSCSAIASRSATAASARAMPSS